MWKKRLLFLCAAALALLGCISGEALPADAPAEIPAEIKYIALTFDDGPRRSTTEKLLNGLKERGASATFFLVGEGISGNEDLIRRMAAEGHQIGNHTWSHVRLAGSPAKTVAEEIRMTEAALQDILGGSGYWLRPPYGLIDEETEIPVPMVKWSVDPRDWEKRDTAKVKQAILQNVRPNAIILLHDIYPSSVDAALQIVDTLQQEGYWFVTVEELLRLNGITPQAGIMYRSGIS